MIKKLTSHGNSSALVIDRAILDLLDIDPQHTLLNIETDGKCLIVSPIHDKERRKKFLKALESGNRKYAKMLKRLAD